jgi:hypothetical protein
VATVVSLTVPRPLRRFLRFSVRGLIVLVLVTGCWLGWIVRSAHIQRESVRRVSRAFATVSYNWEWSDGDYIVDGAPSLPEPLVRLLGVDFPGTVVAVRFPSELGLTLEEAQLGTSTLRG